VIGFHLAPGLAQVSYTEQLKVTAMLLLVCPFFFLVILFLFPVSTVHSQGSAFSLRLFGHGVNGIDRVEIPLDAPARPADIGAGDFTLEFWLKANTAENDAGNCSPGNDNWITGNIILDRDIYGAGDFGDFGISLFHNGLAFGVFAGGSGAGLCGDTDVADGQWHHIAVTRDAGTGDITLWVDGQLDGAADGPTGDMSYRNGRSTGFAKDPFLVIGAEKHDAGAAYLSYSGWLDELRLSTTVRYTAAFVPPTTVFAPDAATVALYHFDEGPAGACTSTVLDSSGAVGGPSHGACRFGGAGTPGPVYSTDVPLLGDPLCGNGALDPGEECDDGDTTDGDGCDSNCRVTACGNGIVTSGEECDDANLITSDGCEADCTRTPYTLVSGKSLLVRDKSGAPSFRKVAILSRSQFVIPPPPSSTGDPTRHGARIRLGRGAAEVDTYILPASGWQGLGNPAGTGGYRYRDRQRVNGPCAGVLLRPGYFKADCAGSQIAFSLDEPSQGALTVTFEPGAGVRSCLVFGGNIVKDAPAAPGSIGRFLAKNAPAPVSCPFP
jgi:cysteine-rich repeat protein